MANCFVCHSKEMAGVCTNSDCPRNKLTTKVKKSQKEGDSSEQVRNGS